MGTVLKRGAFHYLKFMWTLNLSLTVMNSNEKVESVHHSYLGQIVEKKRVQRLTGINE